MCPNTNKYLLPDLLILGVSMLGFVEGGGLCIVIVVRVVVRDTEIGVFGILLAGDASSSPPVSTPPGRHFLADSKKKKSLRSWYI